MVGRLGTALGAFAYTMRPLRLRKEGPLTGSKCGEW